MKVLIVDEMHENIVSLLQNLNLDVDYQPGFTKADALVIIAEYDGLIIRSKFFIDDDFLASADKLKFIGRAGAGLDLIDLTACKKRNIQVFAANEANKVAVAEHLLGMILCLFNNIIKGDHEVKAGIWLREENRGEELFGKTIGVIGFGNNGSETAKRFAAFGCKVLVYDKYKSGFSEGNIFEANLDQIFAETEILTLHIPLTDETKAWINADFFKHFIKQIYFCNVARGEIVIQDDLVEALKNGKVKGACLDVLENEKLAKLSAEQKLSFDYLRNHPRVIMSPHVAGWTFESYEKINQVLSEKIKVFLI